MELLDGLKEAFQGSSLIRTSCYNALQVVQKPTQNRLSNLFWSLELSDATLKPMVFMTPFKYVFFADNAFINAKLVSTYIPCLVYLSFFLPQPAFTTAKRVGRREDAKYAQALAHHRM